MITDLEANVSRVRSLRLSVSIMKDMIDKRMAMWEEENRELMDAIEAERIRLREEEEKLRAATLEAYQETGNKKPAPGVGIRIAKCVEYDPKFALTWAKNQGIAIKLDAPAFEKAVLAFSEDDRENLGLDEICKVWEKPTATISKEL